MNELACLSDLRDYESDRYQWLIENQGELSGFTTSHGKLLVEQAGDAEHLKAHLVMPRYIDTATVTRENRCLLGELLNAHKATYAPVTGTHISQARDYVEGLFGTELSFVNVLCAPQHVMQPSSLGTVYSNGRGQHLIVIPDQSFDPLGVLVRQFAIAALYTLVRETNSIAAMMSNEISQAMIGLYALLRFAAEHPDECLIERHLQMLVTWEFAKGLSRSVEMPLGFVASDLGEQLMRNYGEGMFKAVLQDLYESAPNGQAIWFGSSNFTGAVLALGLLDKGDNAGMTQFMKIDTGDRKLADKLREAFPELSDDGLENLPSEFNARLESVLLKAGAIPAAL